MDWLTQMAVLQATSEVPVYHALYCADRLIPYCVYIPYSPRQPLITPRPETETISNYFKVILYLETVSKISNAFMDRSLLACMAVWWYGELLKMEKIEGGHYDFIYAFNTQALCSVGEQVHFFNFFFALFLCCFCTVAPFLSTPIMSLFY